MCPKSYWWCPIGKQNAFWEINELGRNRSVFLYLRTCPALAWFKLKKFLRKTQSVWSSLGFGPTLRVNANICDRQALGYDVCILQSWSVLCSNAQYRFRDFLKCLLRLEATITLNFLDCYQWDIKFYKWVSSWKFSTRFNTSAIFW